MKTALPVVRLLTLSERAYRALLILYPANFRRDYGHHMTQVFRDTCRDTYRQEGAWGLAFWWGAALFDLLQTVIEQHRKVTFTMSQAKFIQWSGWLCILGGVFFVVSGISQLQGSVRGFEVTLIALIPAMALITLGLIGIYLRYTAQLNLFGKLALLATMVGAVIAVVGWLLVFVVGDNFWQLAVVGWLLYIAGQTVFGGFATTVHLLPKWNWALLIGSALPLTVIVLGFARQDNAGASLGAFLMALLMGISWIVTGWALNSKPAAATQVAMST
jgi:hypothetical protein